MKFLERKKEKGFTYDVEDVFGTVHIESTEKLNGDTLDNIVMALMRQNIRAETVTGEVENGDAIIKYTFKKASIWSDDDEEEICKDTHTSTQEPEREYIPMFSFVKRISNWLRRFVAAFREAYRNVNK